MSADVLRRAAALMREVAEKASEQPQTDVRAEGVWLNSRFHMTIDPAVALAVADWLEGVAELEERNLREMGFSLIEIAHPVAVARAYIGGPS